MTVPIHIKQCDRCRRFCADGDTRTRQCPHPNPEPGGGGTCGHQARLVDRPDVEAAYRLKGAEILGIPSEPPTVADRLAAGESCPICAADPEQLTHMHPAQDAGHDETA